jgi:hypothetical protein
MTKSKSSSTEASKKKREPKPDKASKKKSKNEAASKADPLPPLAATSSQQLTDPIDRDPASCIADLTPLSINTSDVQNLTANCSLVTTATTTTDNTGSQQPQHAHLPHSASFVSNSASMSPANTVSLHSNRSSNSSHKSADSTDLNNNSVVAHNRNESSSSLLRHVKGELSVSVSAAEDKDANVVLALTPVTFSDTEKHSQKSSSVSGKQKKSATKNNKKFHQLFPSISLEEHVIESKTHSHIFFDLQW